MKTDLECRYNLFFITCLMLSVILSYFLVYFCIFAYLNIASKRCRTLYLFTYVNPAISVKLQTFIRNFDR